MDFFTYDGDRRYLLLDPRTKVLLLVMISTLMLGGGNDGYMRFVRPLLSLVPFALMLSERRVRQALKYLLFYAVCYVAEFLAVEYLSGTAAFLLLAVSSIMTKFAPGIMMGAFLLSTTSVSEFVASMERMHITDKIVIPLSVIFRFFPTIGEEYRAIADAMSMRQIRVGGKKPLKMIEYRIIPLMVSVVKIGDELSAAALTRGLGAPVKRTNICKIGFHWQDILLILFSVLCLSVYLVQVLR
jgi:energy-coupling factor transporter transmembrane protein EcfT